MTSRGLCPALPPTSQWAPRVETEGTVWLFLAVPQEALGNLKLQSQTDLGEWLSSQTKGSLRQGSPTPGLSNTASRLLMEEFLRVHIRAVLGTPGKPGTLQTLPNALRTTPKAQA